MNLTAIKNAPEGAVLSDDEVGGLQLRVRNGRKAFYFYYRVVGTGQRRKPKIGDYPGMTIQQAREIAREWIGDIARGKDPSGERATLRASEKVCDLLERYLTETATRASYRYDKGRVRNVLIPAWGEMRVSQVGRAELLALRRQMRGSPIAFNRMKALVSQAWKFGDYPGIVGNVKPYPEHARRRYLTEDERQRFLEALDETEIQYPHACALIRLLYLTGARFSEIAKAKRTQYRDGVLTLPKHKTSAKVGARTIIFSQDARDVVDGIDARGGWLVGFSSGPWTAWGLIRDRAKLENFRLHDLRHSFASDALGAGFDLAAIGEVLGHKDAATTKRYSHLAESKQLAVAEAVAASRKTPTPGETP